LDRRNPKGTLMRKILVAAAIAAGGLAVWRRTSLKKGIDGVSGATRSAVLRRDRVDDTTTIDEHADSIVEAERGVDEVAS
jgi:hypothetical protein